MWAMTALRRFLLENHAVHTISAVRGREPVFRDPILARVVVDAIWFSSEERKAFILAYAVMPDHLHVLLIPRYGGTVSDVMHAIKGWSARQINQLLGRRGSLWQQSFYDRVIRDEKHLADTIAYIHQNPVVEGLVADAQDYEFSSASPQARIDTEAFLRA